MGLTNKFGGKIEGTDTHSKPETYKGISPVVKQVCGWYRLGRGAVDEKSQNIKSSLRDNQNHRLEVEIPGCSEYARIALIKIKEFLIYNTISLHTQYLFEKHRYIVFL